MRAKAILEEVHKLVEAGIMREVYYHDWLSNPVMVYKERMVGWRMCGEDISLTLTKRVHKGLLYTTGDRMESGVLMRYHSSALGRILRVSQIQMAKDDEEKTAFHTSQGVYCYTKMPFGLKNAGATYQRLVDNAFEGQVGRNLEVYVDDLVIKSHTEDEVLSKSADKSLHVKTLRVYEEGRLPLGLQKQKKLSRSSKQHKQPPSLDCHPDQERRDFVYRANDASHAEDTGKLGPKWEGPYEVTEALGKGAYKLRDMDGRELPRTWNICNLKKCYL
ncbi:hypothetical protein Tco_0838362 [Tanacetum coccineum]|uniref:Reverse transcriptase domain-containing protein n=1 Tax=Tanacetum coccineum TaxID=301880 RepID=A0ABQ5AMK4_9ASTR